jgi:hypothetical protein
MKSFKNIFRLLPLLFLFTVIVSSCEDVIDVDLAEGETQLVVDAMLTNDSGTQTIYLRKSAAYLNNNLPIGATGAMVKVTDLANREFEFKDLDGTGKYQWVPTGLEPFPFGVPGNVYTLEIKYEGEEYTSVAFMDSVLSIDSLWTEFREQSIQGPDTIKPGYVLNMKAFDIPGEGNCYWFRTYKNGKRYIEPGQINLAYDAAFGPGSDGVEIIPPIVGALSPERFQVGDTVLVECLSIGLPAFYFINQAQRQMTNSGLFAEPPANVPSNIENKNKDSNKKALGWFFAASVERKGLRVEP